MIELNKNDYEKGIDSTVIAANYINGGQMKDITTLIIKSEPFQEVMPKRANEKWSRDINDGSIYKWKKELNA